VALGRRVEHEARAAIALQPGGAHVPAASGRRAMTGRRQRGQRRHRAPADEESEAALGREADQLHQPARGAAFEIDRGVIAAGTAGIEAGGDEIAQHTERGRRRVHPAEEARMAVAHGMRQDLRAAALEQ
jgi:hypothetical protein